MKNGNEVTKFIAGIPIEKISQKCYSVEDAKNIYISQYRDRIYNELKVQYIQNRIRNKILKRKCNLDKDILFRKIDFDKQIDNMNVSGLLSECGEEEEMNCHEESKETDCQEESKETDCQVSIEESKCTIKKKSKLSKYLDLEAEQSEEDSEEEEEDGSDLSSIVDDHQEDENTAADLYAGEKQEKDVEILKKLVKKFRKKRLEKSREIQQCDIENFSSEEEMFSEIPIDDLELKKDVKIFETTKEEQIVNSENKLIKFRNLDDANGKLNKKKKFTFGFGGK